ncbi:MAG: cob(I)yrinic acid a,c-diamide adenosyltransferase [Chloroflexi bacterium]|nr:cob(I)yrinic acid a,c-diamide adenosyltransferase [Chloroflexota bacterium]
MTPSPQRPRPPEPFSRRLVEVFTGNGKGKTSAALGGVVRALGHGLRVHIVYFMKGEYPYGEQPVLEKLENVSFERFGFTDFCDPDNVTEEEKEQAHRALSAARQAMSSGKYDLVVLDEVNVASSWQLIDVQDVVGMIKDKPDRVELILTGRGADPRVIELADLVTEMRKLKHPYDRGILSRKGFDF